MLLLPVYPIRLGLAVAHTTAGPAMGAQQHIRERCPGYALCVAGGGHAVISSPQRNEISMRRNITIALFSVIGGMILALANLQSGQGPVALTSAAINAGYPDFSYQYNGVSNSPSGEKPQSKLWYNDGRWWGSLFNKNTHTYHIYWLDLQSQIWMDTGKTIVFVTHNVTEAIFLADRVVVLSPRPGRLAHIFNIDLPRPRTIEQTFTPEFIQMVLKIKQTIIHGVHQGASDQQGAIGLEL